MPPALETTHVRGVAGWAAAPVESPSQRVRRTVALLARRGYALPAARLGELCLGGAMSEAQVIRSAAAAADLCIAEGLVIERASALRAPEIVQRATSHVQDADPYWRMTRGFVRRLVAIAPFIRSVSIAGSLASGGFQTSDDVDLNLIVDDGHRHLAYVAVNALGLVHALRHRDKPVDDLTRRPLAPRLMTANLILEHGQCFPLVRQDEDMAFELLVSKPVYGAEVVSEILEANPELGEQFPQLDEARTSEIGPVPSALPALLYPRWLDGVARLLGEAAWRYMQWTRRHRPDALARVAFVRSTMRPYALFDRGSGA